MSEQQSAAASYKAHLASRPLKIVDVKVPSGFVFKFTQPNTLGTVLGGELPQTAANEAVAEWKAQGIGIGEGETDLNLDELSEEEKIKVGLKAFSIRDKTLELSYSPKIVIGFANPDRDELSTDEIPDEDLAYLFKWVAAGGSGAYMTAMFPQGREQHIISGISGKKLRKARKRNGKANVAA